MIRKTKNPAEEDQTVSVIGPSMEINGTVKCSGVMQLGGLLTGEIDCQEMQVTAAGRLEGAVRADIVSINGEVAGSVHAEAVSVGTTGRITGEIHYQRISVEQGAVLSADLFCLNAKPQNQAKSGTGPGNTDQATENQKDSEAE